MANDKVTDIRIRRETADISERLQTIIDNAEDPIVMRSQIAHDMGITQSTLISLLIHEQPYSNLPYSALRVMARYLKIPGIVLFRELELIQPSDFLPVEDNDDLIEQIYSKMILDPRFAAIAPNNREWEKTPYSIKIMLCVLYERLTSDFLSNGSINDRLGLRE